MSKSVTSPDAGGPPTRRWRNLIDDHGTTYTTATGATWETPQSDSPVIDVAEDLGDTTDYYGNGIV